LKSTQESSTKEAEHQLSVLNEQIEAEKEKNVSLEAKINETVINNKIKMFKVYALIQIMCFYFHRIKKSET
jgi:hypothetical protein